MSDRALIRAGRAGAVLAAIRSGARLIAVGLPCQSWRMAGRRGSGGAAAANCWPRPGRADGRDVSGLVGGHVAVVEDALLTTVGSDHVLNRWSGYDPTADRVRVGPLTRPRPQDVTDPDHDALDWVITMA